MSFIDRLFEPKQIAVGIKYVCLFHILLNSYENGGITWVMWYSVASLTLYALDSDKGMLSLSNFFWLFIVVIPLIGAFCALPVRAFIWAFNY